MPVTATPTYFQVQSTPIPRPPPKKQPTPVKPPRKPLLRLEIRDLSSIGAKAFLTQPDCSTILEDAVQSVLNLLYKPDSKIPHIRSVTLILRDMDGVAYTTGSDLDQDHKEIHFSTRYISQVPEPRRREEILGVIRHEMVHVWQWNACGTCPGGLIEGIADYVRLRAGLGASHWHREWEGDWDAGYQKTGYFLDWLEERIGEGIVININGKLRDGEYKGEEFWKGCCGKEVGELWKEYGEAMEKKYGKDGKGPVKDAGNKEDEDEERQSYAEILDDA